MQHWYIYYKVPRAQVAPVAAQARAMLDALGAATGVHGRLLRRTDDGGASTTLMEQYDGIADTASFAQALAVAVQNAGFGAELRAQRRVERFGEI